MNKNTYISEACEQKIIRCVSGKLYLVDFLRRKRVKQVKASGRYGAILNKHYVATFIFFVLILSLVGLLGEQIVNNGDVWGKVDVNNFNSFYFFDFSQIVTFLKKILINCVICIGISIVNIVSQKKSSNSKITSKKIFVIACLVFVAAWLPYVLSCMPGGIFADTFASISQAINMDDSGFRALNNHHPILYTLFWRGIILISRRMGHDIFFACFLFLIIQFLIIAVSMAYMVAWGYKKGVSFTVTILLILFIALFPMFPMWTVSIWKDTYFGLALLYLSMLLGELVFYDGDEDLLDNERYLIKFFAVGLFVGFTRNNGKYVLYVILVFLIVSRIKVAVKRMKMFGCFIAIILSIQIVQGPVYDSLDYNTDEMVESLAVPIQQMAYLVACDYDLTEEELNYIATIAPIESVKEYYNPMIFDSLKWYAPNFNMELIKSNPREFFYNYFCLLLKYPQGCFKAWALETCGFWAPNIKLPTGGDMLIDVWNNGFSITSVDYFKQFTGLDLKSKIRELLPIYGARYVFCMFYCLYLLVANQDYKKVIILLPALLNWLTIMIATPIAGSFRYINISLLILPIEIMLISSSKSKRNYE